MDHRNSLYRFGTAWGFIVLLGMGTTALTFFARRIAREDHSAVADDVPYAHAIIGSELVRIWLPRASWSWQSARRNSRSCKREKIWNEYSKV